MFFKKYLNVKVLNLNNTNKRIIKEKLDELLNGNYSKELRSKIRNLFNRVDETASDNKKCIEFDSKIISLLNAALDNKTSESSVALYVNKASELLLKRNSSGIMENSDFFNKPKKVIKQERKLKLKQTKNNLNDLLTPEDLITITLDQLNDKKEKLLTELDNANSSVMYNAIKTKITTIDNQLKMYGNELLKNVLYENYKSLSEEEKKARNINGFSDADFEDAADKIKNFGIEITEQTEKLENIIDEYTNNSSNGKTNSASKSKYESTSSLNATKSSNNGDIDEFEMRQIFKNLDENIEKLEQRLGELNNELDILNNERGNLAEDLKELLLERKDATASECKILDSKINQLQKKYQINGRNIDEKINAISTLNEYLDHSNMLKNVRDRKENDEKIIFGKFGMFDDMERTALYIKNYIEKCNEKLDSSSMANSVASSSSWNTSSIASTDLNNTYTGEVKDDDKFKDLEIELGIRQKN